MSQDEEDSNGEPSPKGEGLRFFIPHSDEESPREVQALPQIAISWQS